MILDTEKILFYEIDPSYIDYLLPYAPHLFQNKQKHQHNNRKYIGVVLTINEMYYFAPLSSYKPKHEIMKEGLDFIKVKHYAVINLNNMFPVPTNSCTYMDFSEEKNQKYKDLLLAEYRYIKMIQDRIRKNARLLYTHKVKKGNLTSLGKRCNNFLLLEIKCKEYNLEHS